ncbi:uncharacterized protein AB675_423 [Cyphellophora attinorum]|uniref:Uncharacterized protein n=1 Tax=Cyphellophora attinorum TaxID=1664694 RepID=A0A0N1HHR9_9EURO|nr:uncharacterized protein AB675_423 [Phialophora attinorum]KPI45646.1 hypothetical protein AB675_423 [Phialophora attinorum]
MPAAVGTKPVLPPLQTPKTASFPSEIVETPVSACISALVKQEQSLQTPITPPAAYTDFLKALTPVLASPPPSALSRSVSDESTSSRCSVTSMPTNTIPEPVAAEDRKPPRSAGSLPPTPFRRSSSGLRRLKIPQSPAYSPSTCGPSPRTGVSSMPHGSAIFSPFSPADWSLDSSSRRFCDTPASACSNPVSVRSVVTRTVTYKRSPPLDPAPRGKRRKISEEAGEMPPPSTPTVTAPTVVV